MYRIGEFSKITQLTVKALRYYDEIDLLKPATISEETGYRFYDAENFEKAMVIKMLKSYDFTIKEIKEVTDQIEGPEDLAAYLLEKSDQMNKKILALKGMQKKIENQVSQLKDVKVMSNTEKVCIKEVDELQIASIRYKGRYDEFGKYVGKLFSKVGGNAAGEPFSLYYDDEYTEENADIEACVPVKKAINKSEVTTRTLKAQKVVSIVHVGSYDTLSHSYKAIADYMNENDLKGLTPTREIYIKGPGMMFKGNPEKYRTEIQIPVE